MPTIISYAVITFYDRKSTRPSYSYVACNENIELINKLFDYHKLLNVVAYEQDEFGVRWFMNDYWYDEDQISRMVDLKVFC